MSDDLDQTTAVESSTAVRSPSASTLITDEVWNGAIGAWVDGHLRSTPVSQSIDGWNHLMTVIPRLRDLLEAALKK